MANYCSNSIAFYSKDKAVLAKLFDNINNILDNTKDRSIYELLKSCGYSSEEAVQISDRRDALTYADDNITESPCGYCYFKADTESAWQPNMTSFFRLLQEKFGSKISLVYVSEEPGCGIFINTDVDGLFFSDRYRIDYCVADEYITEYFTDFKDVVCFLRENLPQADVCLYDSPEEIKNKISDVYDDDNNFYFNLDRFSCNYETRWN